MKLASKLDVVVASIVLTFLFGFCLGYSHGWSRHPSRIHSTGGGIFIEHVVAAPRSVRLESQTFRSIRNLQYHGDGSISFDGQPAGGSSRRIQVPRTTPWMVETGGGLDWEKVGDADGLYGLGYIIDYARALRRQREISRGS